MTRDLHARGQWPSIIGGRQVTTSEAIEVLDPADGTPIATVTRAGRSEIDAAVDAARTAFDRTWRATSAAERADFLRRIAQVIRENSDELAELESRDVGKPISQARIDLGFITRYFDYYSNMIEAHFGHVVPAATDRLTLSLREPHGVTGHIIPWNFPLGMFGRTIAPALAAGNCCVLKPAEDAPLSSIRVADLALEAGLPPGVLNVVPGLGEEAGDALAKHPGLDHISFTGSVEIGRRVGIESARLLRTVTLELGGKSANVVLEDADLDDAVPQLARAILLNAGQVCSAGSRIVVLRKVHDELVDRLAEQFKAVTIGRGLDDPDLGPLISAKQKGRVLEMISSGRTEGRLVVGGGEPKVDGLSGGFFVEPTLIDGVAASAEIAQKEVFGPVLTVTSVEDEDEALAAANSTRYGLGAGVWTRDVGRAHWLVQNLEAGQVMVNTFSNGVEMPFSGRKDSGYGVEKSFEALDEYTRVKGAVLSFGRRG